ncbi:hypothetical protein ROSI111154_03970 [Rouxiella silvae]
MLTLVVIAALSVVISLLLLQKLATEPTLSPSKP